MVESDLFRDEYPRWDLGTLHQLVILHEMFLHATAKGWQETDHMWHRGCQERVKEPDPEAGQSALELIGYHTFRAEIRDVYHSVYLLNRALGFPSCRAAQQRMAIQEILFYLQERLRRWVPPDRTGDLPVKARGQSPPQSYEAALQAAHQKMMETTTALQSDLDRLNWESRGRSHTHVRNGSWCRMWSSSQCRMQSNSRRRVHSRSQHQAHSQGQSEDRARSGSQDCHQTHLLGKWVCSLKHTQEHPHRRVSFHMPEGRDITTERKEPVTKPAIKDLEAWLEHQAGQLGTPSWWRELEAVLDIKDTCKFA